jgi:hypothetical protein
MSDNYWRRGWHCQSGADAPKFKPEMPFIHVLRLFAETCTKCGVSPLHH